MSYVNIQDRRIPFFVRYIADLITYRHLCGKLVSSDLNARFRRTKLGILWALVQPLGFALLIAVVWGSLHKSTSYWEFALYVFSGYIVWEFFSNVVMGSQDALIGAAGYIKQTRVPFLVFQVRGVLTSSVILFFATIGLLGFQLVLQAVPPLGVHLTLLPAFFGVFFFFTVPIAIIMSIMGTLYRDVRHISGLALQALFFISPIMLTREILDEPQLRFLLFANPMVSVIDLFRDPILYGRMWEAHDLILVSAWAGALWVGAFIVAVSVGRRIVFAL